MGKESSAPQAPDPAKVIPLQTQANKDMFNYALQGMRANSNDPYGSISWDKTPSFDQAGYDAAMAKYQQGASSGGGQPRFDYANVDENGLPKLVESGGGTSGGPAPDRSAFTSYNWTMNKTLSPGQQKLFDADMGAKQGLAELLGGLTSRVGAATSKPLDFSSVPKLQSAGYDKRASDAFFSQGQRYLQPQQQQATQGLEARLAEQGFVPGTPAYSQAMSDLRKTQDMAMGDLTDRSVTRGFDVGLRQAQFGNQSRAQGISELLAQRQYPLNELNSLRSGSQVQMPNLQAEYSAPGLQAPDVMGAYQNQYMGQLGAHNAQVGSQNALMGDMFGLAGAAMGAPWMGPLMGIANNGGR